MGPGGNPDTMYVLYGESICVSATVRCSFGVGSTYCTVAQLCSGMPILSRRKNTPAITGRSSGTFASRSTMEASTRASLGVSPRMSASELPDCSAPSSLD